MSTTAAESADSPGLSGRAAIVGARHGRPIFASEAVQVDFLGQHADNAILRIDAIECALRPAEHLYTLQIEGAGIGSERVPDEAEWH